MGQDSCSPPEGAMVVVVGSCLRAEEKDRPLAYCVRKALLDRLGHAGPPVYVVSDYRYLSEKSLALLPAISIGGPGVNAVAGKWAETMPLAVAVEDEFFIQWQDSEQGGVRASVWGIDHDATCIAVATFIEHHLDRFLNARIAPVEHF